MSAQQASALYHWHCALVEAQIEGREVWRVDTHRRVYFKPH